MVSPCPPPAKACSRVSEAGADAAEIRLSTVWDTFPASCATPTALSAPPASSIALPSVAVPTFRLPASTRTAPVPRASSPAASMLPAPIVVPPAWTLAPERRNVPAPSLVRPAVASPDSTPPRLSVSPAAATPMAAGPVRLKAPL